MTQSFYPITPVEVTPGSTGWQDVDVSAHIPVGATGVILHIVNTNTGTDYNTGLRKNGSTDARIAKTRKYSHFWAMIGVDSNRVFEAYIGNTTYIDIYLVGYTVSGVTFFTNAYDKSLSVYNSWEDIDCHTECPGAVGLIFESPNPNPYVSGFRNNGSTDDRRAVGWYGHVWWVVGCDSNQICEMYAGDSTVDCYLIGYITDGAVFNVNATDLSLGSTGSYIDLAALPANSVMGFIEVLTGGSSYSYALRKNGSSESLYYDCTWHHNAIVECDDSGIIEGKIENTSVDFFLLGYATKSSGWSSISKVNGIVAIDLSKVDGIVVANIAKITGIAV